MVLAPWYSFAARRFMPRVSLLREDGYPLKHIDGPDGFTTYEEALEASRFLIGRLPNANL